MEWRDWYDALDKPSWTPSGGTIGMIWSILYPILFVSIAVVMIQAFRSRLSWWIVLPFGINLIANLLFTPLFFDLRSLPLAAIDILIVWGTIVWMIVATAKPLPWIAVAQIPYLVWVSIATVIQLTITWRNA